MNIFLCLLTCCLASLPALVSASAGPHQTAAAEYRFPADIDPEILSDRQTEIWGKVFYPTDMNNINGKLPLIVILHGNHGTCGKGSHPRRDNNCRYTNEGTCPEGYVVTPNHAGYDYLAEHLASWGYLVTSINANRGITCGAGVVNDSGLNLARGKLVLKHLSLFYQWSTEGGAPESLGLGANGLLGKIDFTTVGLLGHSRGGEGMRAAYNLYLDANSIWPTKIPGLSIKAIYEIGAVDGQTSRQLNANGAVWNQLLPMCDGDVSNLQGRYPFERMLLNPSEPPEAQKSLYEVWGANHNYFNTEWQTSDADDCAAGTPLFNPTEESSTQQQSIALTSVSAFFRSHLGKETSLNQQFNPLHALPSVITDITQIDRDFTPSPSALEIAVIDDFDKDTGMNSSGNENIAAQIDIVHKNLVKRHVQRVANIAWRVASQSTLFESVFAGPGLGRDLHAYATLDFRIARASDDLNVEPTTDFGIQLEDARGHLSNEIMVSEYAVINGPGTDNDVLKAVRIPLSAFHGIDMTKVHGVRFVFDKTETGVLYLANIRAHRHLGVGDEVNATLQHLPRTKVVKKTLAVQYVPAALNTIRSIHVVQKSSVMSGQRAVEIRVASKVPFPVLDRLPVLRIGDKEFTLSRYTDTDELKEMVFSVPAEEYSRLVGKSEVVVVDGKVWEFGEW